MAKSKKQPPAKMLAVLGRSRRTGRWRLAKVTNVLALLGGCRIDMRHAVIEDESLTMKITVLFGSASVLLPRGALVQPSGISLLSASTVEVAEEEPEGDVPTIAIEWLTLFGRLKVTHPPAEPVIVTQVVQAPAAPAAVADEDDDDVDEAA